MEAPEYREFQSNTSDLAEQSSPTSPPSRRQQILGVFLIVSVAIIWVLSAEFIQRIFGKFNYQKPYALSYTSVAAFSVLLFGFVDPSWRRMLNVLPEYNFLGSKDANPTPIETSDSNPTSFLYILKLALLLAPFFFICNWTFNLGLAYTSVASSSIIATLTSLFTLFLGAVTGVEQFSYSKLAATLMCITGVSVIVLVDERSRSDNGAGGSNLVLGDALSVFSAALYSCYTIILKHKTGREGDVNIAMLLGLLGGTVAIFAMPGLYVVHVLGLEKFEWPDKRVAISLLLNAAIGTVLSDFLWAKSVVLTTPMTTTLALSLTVPLSLLMDVVFRQKDFGVAYIIGAGLVFFGFIVVNMDVASLRHTHEDESRHTDG